MSNISRKEFLKLTSLGALGLQAGGFGMAERRRPNVLFIYVDDLGYGDLGSYGNTDIATPHMDRLAAGGTRFTNYYATSPICSPSRVAAATGQYPARHGIHSFLASRRRNRARGMNHYLDPAAPSMARAFREAGYATAHFGKWHMGGGRDVDDAPRPAAYGFDQSLVSFEGLGDRLLEKDQDNNLSKQSARLGQGRIEWVNKWEKTGIYADRTIDFIKQNRQEPFYIQLWPGDVHDPFKPRDTWRDEFQAYDKNPYQRDFFAVLSNLDTQVGRVLNTLDDLQLAENTMVVLASDNGPTDWPRYYEQFYWPPGSTGPFRGRKWSLYEGGIRMPLIVRWPGQVKAGSVNDTTVVHSCDLFPTFCAMAGVPAPPADFDGVDMSRAFYGEQYARKGPVYWEYGRDDRYLQPGNPRFRSPNLAMREGKWKLLVNADGSDPQLYNLKTDHAETTSLREQYPDRARRMADKVRGWRRTLA